MILPLYGECSLANLMVSGSIPTRSFSTFKREGISLEQTPMKKEQFEFKEPYNVHSKAPNRLARFNAVVENVHNNNNETI